MKKKNLLTNLEKNTVKLFEQTILKPGAVLHILDEKVINPKEEIGDTKTPHHLVPPRVLKEVAWAMKEGADKYGAYNYRKAGVKYHTYYSSTRRHIDEWYEGEDIDPASGLNHIVKAIAGLIVLYDSILENNATDDRPNKK